MVRVMLEESSSSLALLSLVFVLLFIGRANADATRSDFDTQMSSYSGNFSEIVDGNNRFALDMYREINDQQKNAFFSPWSIYSALAMVYEGARGKTSDEMQSVMHFPKNNSIRRQSFASLYGKINANDSDYVLSNANALWVQKEYPLLSEYTAAVNKYYHGKASSVDFAGAPDYARKTINSWVEINTNNKIKDLLSPDDIDESIRLVLTNAIYFKGTWIREFDKNATHDDQFKTGDGKTIMVPMMSLKSSLFNYIETEDAQILELPYKGDNISMLIFLPKGDNLPRLEKLLSMAKIEEWKNGLNEQEVEVHIPKFTSNAKYSLADNLGNMGILTAFTSGADFSGISSEKPLFISNVVHQAFIGVDEKGTEAAAATATAVRVASLPLQTPVFRADHPFIFMIQDKNTGLIMFIGRVSDPSEK